MKPLNVFIGPNGAGKSNFIGIFTLLHYIIEQRLGVYVGEQGGASSLLHFGRKRTQRLSLKLEIADGTNRYGCTLSPNAEDGLFFEDFVPAPSGLNPEKIRLEWKEKGSDEYFNASALSDGTLRFICLATLLLQPSLPSVVLIDEPELGLHPAAIVLLAELLRSTSKRSQVIVSTQSVTLINQLSPEEVVVVEHQDNTSSFRRLDEEQSLTGLSRRAGSLSHSAVASAYSHSPSLWHPQSRTS